MRILLSVVWVQERDKDGEQSCRCGDVRLHATCGQLSRIYRTRVCQPSETTKRGAGVDAYQDCGSDQMF